MFMAFTTLVLAKAENFVVADYQAPLKLSAKQIREKHSDTKNLLIVDALSSGIDYVSIRYYLGPEYNSKVSGLTWRPHGVPLPELQKLLADYDGVFVHTAPVSLLQALAKINNEQ
jgi:hypothetical protein